MGIANDSPASPTDTDLPSYDGLPVDQFGTRSAWGLFGSDDSLGKVNLQTADRIRAAAGLVRTGEVFSLNADLGVIDPPFFERQRHRHRLIAFEGGDALDDVVDNLYLQSSSQWDSLAHAGYSAGLFYNGAETRDITECHRNTIEHWARRGIVGRGVLLDVEAMLGGAGEGFDPSESRPIGVDELDAAREAANISFEPGDVLLVNTGYLRWYRKQPRSVRRKWSGDRLSAVGLEHSEAMARYLWNTHASAIASDNPAVEVWPPSPDPGHWPFGYLHTVLIGQFGLALGELWDLEALVENCRDDGRCEMLVTSAPLHLIGGIGSPANALAIK